VRATLYIEPIGNQRVVTVDHIPDLRRANDFHNRRKADVVEHFRSLNVSATTEITIRTREGVTARTDIIIIGEEGTTVELPPGFAGETIDGSTRNYIQLDENRMAIIENKTGNAKLTDGQKVFVIPWLVVKIHMIN
jgi:hypothetical protein